MLAARAVHDGFSVVVDCAGAAPFGRVRRLAELTTSLPGGLMSYRDSQVQAVAAAAELRHAANHHRTNIDQYRRCYDLAPDWPAKAAMARGAWRHALALRSLTGG